MRRLICLLVALTLIVACASACVAEAAEGLVRNYILIIDNSRSTTGRHSLGGATDPSGLRFDAAKLVYENVLASAEAGGRGQIGVIVFCGPENCVSYGPMDIDARPEAMDEAIGSKLNEAANQDRRDNYTDIRTALEAARDMMLGFGDGDTSVILLTDGVNDLKNLSDPFSQPENIEANDLSVELVGDIHGRGAGFFVIALTASNAVSNKDAFMEFINRMAAAGGGAAQEDGAYGNVLMATQDDLNSKLLQLLILAEGANGAPIQTISQDTPVRATITVPYEGISEATVNITFMPEDKARLEAVKLVAPDGTARAVYGEGSAIQADDVAVTEDRSYIMLDIPAPQAGEWELDITAKDGAAVPINAVVRLNPNMRLVATLPEDAAQNVEARIEARLQRHNGEAYEDITGGDVYALTKAVLTLTSPGGEGRSVDMRADGDRFVATFTPDAVGTWTAGIAAENDYWSGTLEGLEMEVGPEPTTAPDEGDGVSVKEGDVTWNVKNGKDDKHVNVSWKGGEDGATAELKAEGSDTPIASGIHSGDEVDLSGLEENQQYALVISPSGGGDGGAIPKVQKIDLQIVPPSGEAASVMLQVADAVMKLDPKLMTTEEDAKELAKSLQDVEDKINNDGKGSGSSDPGNLGQPADGSATPTPKPTKKPASQQGGAEDSDEKTDEAGDTATAAPEPTATELPGETVAPAKAEEKKAFSFDLESLIELAKANWLYLAIGAGVLVLIIVISVIVKNTGGERVSGNLRVECDAIKLSMLLRFEGKGRIRVGEPLSRHPDIAKLKPSKVYDVLSHIDVTMTQADCFGKAPGSDAEHKPGDPLIRLTTTDPVSGESAFCDVGKNDAGPTALVVKDAGRSYELTCSGDLTFDEIIYNKK